MGIVVACLCLPGRALAHADDWRTGVTVATRFDEGSRVGVGDGDWVSSFTPQVSLYRRGSLTRWELDASRRFDSLPEARSPRAASDVARLDFSTRPAEDAEIALKGWFRGSRDLVALDAGSPVTSGLTESADGLALASFWRGEVTWNGRSKSRDATGAADGWSQDASVTVFPFRSATHALQLRGGYQDWTIDDRRALRVVRGLGGYRREHTPWVSSQVEVGVAEIRDDRTGTTEHEVAWAAAVTGFARAMGLPFASRVRVASDVATTGSVELQRTLGGVSVEAKWERSVRAEGGAFTAPALRDFASIGIQDTLAAGVVVAVEGNYGRTRLLEGAEPRIETWRASGSLARPVRPWLTGRATYGYLRQVESSVAATEQFHRGRVEFALNASF